MKKNYQAPKTSVQTVKPHKILCTSPEEEMYGLSGNPGKDIDETDGGSIFTILLLCALMLSGCAKDLPDGRTTIHLVTEGTKTCISYDENSKKYIPSWTAGDQLGVYLNQEHNATDALAEDCQSATFSFTIPQTNSKTEYNICAYYPCSTLGSGYENSSVNITPDQWPSESSFDKSADILSGKPVTVTVSPGETSVTSSLRFARKTAIIKLLPTCAEKNPYIKSLTVTMDKNICGTASWNIKTNSALTLGEDASASVTLHYCDNTHHLNDPVWISIAPVSGVSTLAFTIELQDGGFLQAAASGKNLTFAEGSLTKFTLPVDKNWKESAKEQNYYERISQSSQIVSGQIYMIAATDESGAYCLPNTATKNNLTADVVPSKDTIWLGNENTDWQIIKDGDQVKIKSAIANKYLYCEDGLRVGDTQTLWTVTEVPGKGLFQINKTDENLYLNYYDNYWRARTASYSTGTDQIRLYRKIN